MGWQPPKKNWQPADAVSADDFNRIEGNIADLEERKAEKDLSNVADIDILTKLQNVDGEGSGLDADTLDGLHAHEVIKLFPPPIPEGSTAYFKKQLIDEIIGIKPDGYDGSSITNYGLRTSSDGTTLIVTERTDDVPFLGVTSFAVEEGTTNLIPAAARNDWNQWVKSGHTDTGKTVATPFGGQAKVWSVADEGYAYLDLPAGTFSDGERSTVSLYVMLNVDYTFRLRWNNRYVSVFAPAGRWTRLVNYQVYDSSQPNADRILIGYRDLDGAANPPPGFEVAYCMAQAEKKPFATSFVDGTRADGRFHIPLDRLGFDPATDNWVVAYWKKPIAGHDGTQSGQNLGYFGYYTSDFPVGYIYWGKRNGGNAFILTATYNDGTMSSSASSAFDPQWYWNNWHFEVIKREGNIISFYVDGVLQCQVTLTKPLKSFNYGLSLACHRGQVHTSLLANILLSRDPSVWTDEYIRFLYETQKPFTVHTHTTSDITDINTTHAKVDLSNVDDNTILTKLQNVDGSGSGLDADTVDGKHASDFANTVHTHTTSDITDINTTHAKVDLSNVDDNTILTKLQNVDGSGSGLDADTLDGLHATDFVQQDAAGNVSITGTLDVAGDTTVKGINVLKAFPPAIPEGSTAYFKKQLIDEIIGIKPDGYDGSSITNYGLRTSSDGTTLVVTERKDDVPFPGVTSFAVEEGTTNLFTNPIFQNGETGFDFILAWSSRTIKDGGPLGRYIELVDSGSGGGIYGATFNVTPGQTYTFSVYINVLECQDGGVSLYYHWLNEKGEIISVSTSGTLGEEVPSAFVGQGWRRYKITDTPPANAAKVKAFVYSSEAATSRIQVTGFQFEQKPFPTSFVDGTRGDGILKFTNPPQIGRALPLDNFVINLWFKPTRYPSQTNDWWHLFNVSYNASASQGLELCAPPSANSGTPSNTLSLAVRNSSSTVTRYNLGFDLSAEIGKWHMITLISNGNTVDVYIDGEKRVSVTNDVQRSAIEFIVFGRYFGDISGSAKENGFLMSNVLFASYDPAIWTDEYIRFLYEARKSFYV